MSKVLHWVHNRPASSFMILELCAGSAKLSCEFRLCGFRVLPVDHKNNRHTQRVRCFDMDLTSQCNQTYLLSLINQQHFVYVHVAPPCGTASRARDRPIPEHLRKAGAPCPRPLRNQDHPRGIPDLRPDEQARVRSANAIYDFCVHAAHACNKSGVVFTVENPRNSWFWTVATDYAISVSLNDEWSNLQAVSFQHCMYGSDRDKWSTWLCTPDIFCSLAVVCDNKHSHKPWSVSKTSQGWSFDTAAEAEYPTLLCQRVVSLFLEYCKECGMLPMPVSLTDLITGTHTVPKRRAAAGVLVKGRKLPQLISEFAETFDCNSDQLPVLEHKVLRRYCKREADGTQRDRCVVGIYRSMESFLDLSLCVQHPFDLLFKPLDSQIKSLFRILTSSSSELVKSRLNTLSEIRARRAELEADESQLHASMPEHIRTVLKGKRLLLFKELLEGSGYPDLGIVDDIIRGFDPVGQTPDCGIFEKALIPASISEDELKARAPLARKQLIREIEDTSISENDNELWDQSIKECEHGWLKGPFYSEQAVTDFFKGDVCWNVIRRFAINQHGKLRVIDDGKQGAINSALTVTCKLDLMDCDSLIGLLRFVSEVIDKADKLDFKLSDETRLRGDIHADWKKNPSWVARCLDLKSAYKQLAFSEDKLWSVVLATKDPISGKAVFFVSAALMFGSTSSVYGFNRAARALWHLATHKLGLLSTNFYDDYPCIEPELTAHSARLSFEMLLDLLGWKYATDGTKALPFSKECDVLGVRFNLDGLHSGSFSAGNKPSRIAQLEASVGAFLSDGSLRKSEAHSLAGQLMFAAGHCIGKALRPSIAILQSFAVAKINERQMLEDLVPLALKHVAFCLNSAAPRTFATTDCRKPVVIFTDGSFEPLASGIMEANIGALVVDTATGVRKVFDGKVPQKVLDLWSSTVGLQLITQIELWPVLSCMFVASSICRNRRVVFYIDNDAARESLIKAFSPSLASMSIITAFYVEVENLHIIPWFSRVPSTSNPADLPSRNRSDEACLRFQAHFGGKLAVPKGVFNKLILAKNRAGLVQTFL